MKPIGTGARRGIAARMTLLSLLVAGGVALASCGPQPAAPPGTHAAPGPYYPVIRTPVNGGSPTPGPLAYTVGAWPSTSAPGTAGTVVIYVTFRSGGVPVAGAAITMDVGFPYGWRGYGPTWTDAGGYAAFFLSYRDPFAGRPVLVQVHATYQGQTYDGTTSFTPV